MTHERVDQLTARMGRARILILGDVMLDEYLHGHVERISPEAPVPVVEITSTRLLLGGAANVAANIRALGDEPLLVGVVGDDDASSRLSRLLADRGIKRDYLVTDRTRQTTIKTRILAHDQQVVRADRENRHDLSADVEQRIFDTINAAIDSVSALIISDYGKGVVTVSLLERVIDLCLKKNVFIAVDPKETRFHNYQRVSLITPNHHEASFAAGRKIQSEEDLLAVGAALLDKLKAKAILITRGPEGMSLFRAGESPTHIPTFARKVYDVTGAGDTVIAVFVSAVCAGADLVEAAIVSNAGAGFTVGEIGTATPTVHQVKEELEHTIKNGTVVSRSGRH